MPYFVLGDNLCFEWFIVCKLILRIISCKVPTDNNILEENWNNTKTIQPICNEIVLDNLLHYTYSNLYSLRHCLNQCLLWKCKCKMKYCSVLIDPFAFWLDKRSDWAFSLDCLNSYTGLIVTWLQFYSVSGFTDYYRYIL